MLNSIVKKFENSVVPLCLEDDRTKVRLHGSALYFTYNSKYYLSTAWHVLYEDTANTNFIADKFVYPDGNSFINLPNFHLACDKNLDIALLELEEPLQLFTSYDMNTNVFHEWKTFCCIGYPGKLTKTFNNNCNSILKFFYTEKETNKAFIKNLQKFEIPLKFIKSKCKNINKVPIIFPNPEGMSGGVLVGFDGINYYVYGILTRYNPILKRTFYATVINYEYLLTHLNP